MLELRVARRIGALELRVELSAGKEPLVIVGPNGAGKSSLLRAVLGVLTPDAGRVSLDGAVLFDKEQRIDVPTEERALGYVPQDQALFPHLSVLDNVAFGLSALPRQERLRRARESLESLEVGHLAARSTQALSGGERQRVALARALARRPRALLLDEPFASLDPGARRLLREALSQWLARWQLPVLLVSHDPEDAALARRVAVIERGQLIQQGTLEELRSNPASAFVGQL